MIGNKKQLIPQYNRMSDDLNPWQPEFPAENPRPEPNGYKGDLEQVRHFEPELIEALYAKPETEGGE